MTIENLNERETTIENSSPPRRTKFINHGRKSRFECYKFKYKKINKSKIGPECMKERDED